MSVSKKIIDGNAQPSQGNAIVGLGGARGLDVASKLDSSHILDVESSAQSVSDINSSLSGRQHPQRGFLSIGPKAPAAAYSLRDLWGGGGNYVVRLRRKSDSAEKDFSANDIVPGTTGSELVTNGGFDTDSDWSKGTGWSITGGQAVCDGTQVSNSQLAQGSVGNDLIASGLTYAKLVFTVSACSDFTNAGFRITTNSVFYKLNNLGITTPGTYTLMFAIGSTANRFNFFAEAGVTMTLDDVSCKTYTPSAAEVWAFVGTGGYGSQTTDSAFATTWYDQSGSGNDATQSTAARQPLLIRAGVTNTENGKAALSFDGTDDVLKVTTDISSGLSAHSVFATSNLTYETSAYFIRKTAATNPQNIISGMNRLYNDGSSWRGAGGELGLGYQNLGTWLLPGSSNNSGYSNGVVVESVVAGSQIALDGSDATVGIGGNSVGTNLITGNLQEVIIYDSDQSANRTKIEKDTNDHYNTYVYPDDALLAARNPEAAAAYSLRNLTTNDDNPPNVVRLRRGSDSAESDFTAADIVPGTAGAELVTNGDFATDSNWSKGTGWSITGGQAVCDGTQVSNTYLSQTNVASPEVNGQLFLVEFTIVACSDFTRCGLFFNNSQVQNFGGKYQIASTGTYKCLIEYSDTANSSLNFFASSGETLTIDNVSVKPYTPSAVELWTIENGLSNRISRQNNESAYVTTWYDQSASNEQVFEDPAITDPDGWSTAGVASVTNGLISIENATGAFFARYGTIPAGTYRLQVDYYGVTQGNRILIQVGSGLLLPTGDGTVETIITVSSESNMNITGSGAWSGQTGYITGIRFIDIGNPATQSTSTAQPLLIRAGATNTENGKAALDFDGTDDHFDSLSVSLTGDNSTFAVTDFNDSSSALVGYTAGYIRSRLTDQIRWRIGGSNYDLAGTDLTGQALFSFHRSGTDGTIFRDGSASSSNPVTLASDSLSVSEIGGTTGLFPHTGTIQEIIIYASDQSQKRASIENQINTYYGIY